MLPMCCAIKPPTLVPGLLLLWLRALCLELRLKMHATLIPLLIQLILMRNTYVIVCRPHMAAGMVHVTRVP